MVHRRIQHVVASFAALLPLLLLLAVPAGAQEDAAALIEQLGLRLAPEPVTKRSDWRKPQRIVLPRFSAEQLAALEVVAPEAELIAVNSAREALEHAADADVIIGFCSRALATRARQVRWIQLGTAGAEHCVAALAAAQRTPLVTNMQRVLGPQIAEHALAMMFSLTRGLHRYGDLQRDHRWRRAVPNDARHVGD